MSNDKERCAFARVEQQEASNNDAQVDYVRPSVPFISNRKRKKLERLAAEAELTKGVED